MTKCNSTSNIRKLAEGNTEDRPACLDVVEPVKLLQTRVSKQLQLTEKFGVGAIATADILDNLWKCLSFINSGFTLQHDDKVVDKLLSPSIREFKSHCCRQHYFLKWRSVESLQVHFVSHQDYPSYKMIVSCRSNIVLYLASSEWSELSTRGATVDVWLCYITSKMSLQIFIRVHVSTTLAHQISPRLCYSSANRQ